MVDADVSPYYNPTETDIVIGDDVMRLDPDGEFNLHFPFKRGDLNLHSDIGGSMTSIMTDLQEIWGHVLANQLKINLNDLHLYKAVLVIPDVYNRGHLKELMNLLLVRMGFGSCFLIQVRYENQYDY